MFCNCVAKCLVILPWDIPSPEQLGSLCHPWLQQQSGQMLP
jgi:hypothetical protein